MTAAQLLAGAHVLAERLPGPQVELVKNEVGNLAITDEGAYVGWFDLRDGTVHLFEDGDE